jgi:hypothetical protein
VVSAVCGAAVVLGRDVVVESCQDLGRKALTRNSQLLTPHFRAGR